MSTVVHDSTISIGPIAATPPSVSVVTGLKGDRGDAGPTGPQGLQGFPGPQGLQGPAGPQGIPGINGDTGEQGPSGADGHSPVLTWSTDQIAIDGIVSGPHLTGPQGIPGEGSGDVLGPVTNTDAYVPQWSGANSKTLADGFPVTAAGKAILDDTSAADQRTTLGVAVVGANISYESGVKPGASVTIPIKFPFDVTFPANLVGSEYEASDAPTAEAVVTLTKNGTGFATMTVAIGSTTVATWAGSETTIVAGTDKLAAAFPAQDATWAGVSIMVKGVRS